MNSRSNRSARARADQQAPLPPGELPDAPRTRLLIGWREWASFPSLGIPAIKFKADTGARTSALHAEQIERISVDGKDCVRFLVYPVQRTERYGVTCVAPLIDRRVVKDSGARRQHRNVIETDILLGGMHYPIELTLTDRSDMRFRMLLGRTAMADRLTVAPDESYLLGRVSMRDIYINRRK